jgi:hypothetical protein
VHALGSTPVAWASQRLGRGPGKLVLAQGALVAVGCSELQMSSGFFPFFNWINSNSIQIKFKFLQFIGT